MKTRRITAMTKSVLALVVVLVLALLEHLNVAYAAATINERLIQATQVGDLKEVQLLLEQGADLNTGDKDGMTALMWPAGRKTRE